MAVAEQQARSSESQAEGLASDMHCCSKRESRNQPGGVDLAHEPRDLSFAVL